MYCGTITASKQCENWPQTAPSLPSSPSTSKPQAPPKEEKKGAQAAASGRADFAGSNLCETRPKNPPAQEGSLVTAAGEMEGGARRGRNRPAFSKPKADAKPPPEETERATTRGRGRKSADGDGGREAVGAEAGGLLEDGERSESEASGCVESDEGSEWTEQQLLALQVCTKYPPPSPLSPY